MAMRPAMFKRRALNGSIALLVMIGVWQTGQGVYIHAKAQLAQYLLHSAWQRTLAGAKQVKPWPWADTWPVARLTAPQHGVDLIVLAGASGRTLAFGPGHMTGTPLPGQRGNSVLSAHRDTHFAFLQHAKAGDEIILQTADGAQQIYRLAIATVVDKHDTRVILNTPDARLTLVTCYPFNSLNPGGPLRYVVTAERALSHS